MTWRYGDVLRLTDKFLAEREIAQPDPYRVMFVHDKSVAMGSRITHAGFLGLVLATRSVWGDGQEPFDVGEYRDLSSECFEIDQ